MKHAPRISDAEWEVMKVVWKQPGCTAQEVISALASSQEWSAATIKTLLNRLHSKGALAFEKQGRSYLYRAAFDESEVRSAEAESFLSRVFDGAVSPMIAHFVNSRKLSNRDLEELERIVREGKKNR